MDVPHDRRQVSRLRDHLDILLAGEEQPQASPHPRVVVGEHDLNRQPRPRRVMCVGHSGGEMKVR
jgi:hypothetical protein